MVEGRGGLNIKDYPFAFSMTALWFPNIFDGGNSIPILIGITIIGGMIGSIMTIVNPGGLIIKWLYITFTTKKSLENLKPNNLMNVIINKNFRESLSSPAISFETDKIVGMSYFVIILCASIYRLTSSDFGINIGFNDNHVVIGIVIAFLGLLGILLKILSDTFGVFGFKYKSINHLEKINMVTLHNTTIEMKNFTTEAYKMNKLFTMAEGDIINATICSVFKKYDRDSFSNIDDFNKKFEILPIKIAYEQACPNNEWNNEKRLQRYWSLYEFLKSTSKHYQTDFETILLWFYPHDMEVLTFTADDLYSATQTRDWHTADLIRIRVNQQFEDFISKSRMTLSIP